jgi:centromere protein S
MTANSARDLEVFSKHAGRKVVNTDDVMLLTRRNADLETVVQQELDRIKAADGRVQSNAQPKKRGRPPGGGAGGAKGKGKAKQ